MTKDHFNQTDKGVTINISDEPVQFDKVLVAIGSYDIGLNNTQIKTSDAGHIITNAYQQTEDKHIYAAGDCIGQLQLAHVGSKEAIVAVEHMFDVFIQTQKLLQLVKI